MTELLLPELAQEMAGSNHRVAEFLEAEFRRLEQLRTQLDQGETLKKRVIRTARGAARAAMSRKPETLGVWHDTLELFNEGLSGEQAKELLAKVSATFLR